MKQPLIDPDKVDAWTASMRHAFGTSELGVWLVVGITVGLLLLMLITAWWVSREAKREAATSKPSSQRTGDVRAGHGARTQPLHAELGRTQRRRTGFTPH